MKISAHIALGLFTGLIAYYYFDISVAVIVFVMQVGLVFDARIKKKLKWEPLHTIGFLVLVSVIMGLVNVTYGIATFLSYGLHLFVDLFVYEPLPFLWPLSKKEFTFPVKHSEKIVIIVSGMGSLIFIFKIVT